MQKCFNIQQLTIRYGLLSAQTSYVTTSICITKWHYSITDLCKGLTHYDMTAND